MATTKLKYLRCYSVHGPASTFGREMFNAVKTLVVVDITSAPMYHTTRMCTHDYQDLVFYQADEWSRWWEHAARAVELASR